jgi:hypothetical protein
MPPVARHHFAGHHIQLVVDGDDAKTAYLKSAEGGMFKSSTTEEPMGSYHVRGKHSSVRELDPLSFEFGMSGSKWALSMIEKITGNPAQGHVPFNGSIIHADSNYKCQYMYEFNGARITEFTLPKLDVKSKEFAMLKMKCQPESMNFTLGEGAKLNPGKIDKQKLWHTACFNATFTHAGAVNVSSIEALTVKVGAKAFQIGKVQNPQYTATGKLEMPKLSFVVPMVDCKKILDWFHKAMFKEEGLADGVEGGYEDSLEIEYLDPTRKKVLYSVTLDGVGPETCSVVKGSNESTVGMKFDCYVTKVTLTPSGQGVI